MKAAVTFFQDWLIQKLPARPKKEYGFVFLVHSRNIKDLYRKFRFFKLLPHSWLEWFAMHAWPITVSRITGLTSQKTGKELKGWVIGIPMTAEQMMNNRDQALKKIIEACSLAEKKGAHIIGLGALTSSMSKGGLDLVNKVHLSVTTGHAYTAFNVTRNVFDLIERFGLDKGTVQASVVGAAGSVGSTSARLLARSGFNNIRLVDIEKKTKQLPELAEELKKLNPHVHVKIAHNVNEVIDSDFIVTATNAPQALITNKVLKPGAVVVDDAQPSDVAPEVLDREDVLVVEAGVVHTPHVNNHFNFGLKHRYDNFCCMAEVLILASEEWDKHYVINRATIEMVDHISELGKNLHFELGKFQNLKEIISDEKLEHVKAIARRNHGHN